MAQPAFWPWDSGATVSNTIEWVAQRDRCLRQALIREIEELRGRPLIAMVHMQSPDPRRTVQLDESDILYLADAFERIAAAEEFDLLIHTLGGSTDATQSMLEYLYNCRKTFRAIVPMAAKSAGTIFSLAAKSVAMGRVSQLGPIDPQVDGVPAWYLLRDENTRFAGFAEACIASVRMMAAGAIERGLMRDATPERRKACVDNLMSPDRYPSHGHAIDVDEAEHLGLAVESFEDDDPLWRRIWLLFRLYEADMRRDELTKIYEGSGFSIRVA